MNEDKIARLKCHYRGVILNNFIDHKTKGGHFNVMTIYHIKEHYRLQLIALRMNCENIDTINRLRDLETELNGYVEECKKVFLIK